MAVQHTVGHLDLGFIAEHSETVPVSNGWVGKRAVDVLGSTLLILLLFPVMLVVALAVKLTSPGPVLFRQPRVGRGGPDFPMLKFRTMRTDAEELLEKSPELMAMYLENDHKLPCDIDPRLTRVGRVLRTWSIDELPQLFNVFIGHMSLVGPRPVTSPQLPQYGANLWGYVGLRPGLTGLWQVNGRSQVNFPERGEIDASYLIDCSPWLDVRILVKTPLVVLRRSGSD